MAADLLPDCLFAWKTAKGPFRKDLWTRRVLPALDQVFATLGDRVPLWDLVQRDEIRDMMEGPTRGIVLAHTPAFPFNPHWLSSGRWPAATAAAHAFATQAPWEVPTAFAHGWKAGVESAVHVFTFLLHDAEAHAASAARFFERLVAAGADVGNYSDHTIVDGFASAVRQVICHDTLDGLGPLFDSPHAAPLLHGLARHADGQKLHAWQALPIAVACWRHGLAYGDHGTLLTDDAHRRIATCALSAHQRLMAVAWAQRHGWPAQAQASSCEQLAALLFDHGTNGTP